MPDYILYIIPQGPVLYKSDKGVSDAACPPKCGPAEAGGLSTSSLPFMFHACLAFVPDGPAKKPGYKANSKLMLLALAAYMTFLPSIKMLKKINYFSDWFSHLTKYSVKKIKTMEIINSVLSNVEVKF